MKLSPLTAYDLHILGRIAAGSELGHAVELDTAVERRTVGRLAARGLVTWRHLGGETVAARMA